MWVRVLYRFDALCSLLHSYARSFDVQWPLLPAERSRVHFVWWCKCSKRPCFIRLDVLILKYAHWCALNHVHARSPEQNWWFAPCPPPTPSANMSSWRPRSIVPVLVHLLPYVGARDMVVHIQKWVYGNNISTRSYRTHALERSNVPCERNQFVYAYTNKCMALEYMAKVCLWTYELHSHNRTDTWTPWVGPRNGMQYMPMARAW